MANQKLTNRDTERESEHEMDWFHLKAAVSCKELDLFGDVAEGRLMSAVTNGFFVYI